MLLLRVDASLRIELVASFLEANADVFDWSASLGAIKVRWIWHDCYSRRVPESSQGAWWIVISSAEAFRSAKFLTATDNFMHTNKYCHFYWFLKCMGVFFCLVSSPALFFFSLPLLVKRRRWSPSCRVNVRRLAASRHKTCLRKLTLSGNGRRRESEHDST